MYEKSAPQAEKKARRRRRKSAPQAKKGRGGVGMPRVAAGGNIQSKNVLRNVLLRNFGV